MDRKKEEKQFKYIDIAFGGLNKRNNLILASDLEKLFKEHSSKRKPTECFATYFRYPEEMRQHFVSNGNSVEKYTGPVYTDILPIDIDDKKDLSRAHENAKKAVHALEEIGIDPNVLQAVFSGSKGFHLDVPSILFGIEPSSRLNDVIKQMVRQMLPDIPIDPANYDKVRLWRIPNSINSKNGLYCIPLSVHELLTLSIDDIKALAKNPRNVAVCWDDATEVNPQLHEFFLEVEKHIHEHPNVYQPNGKAKLTLEIINDRCAFLKHCWENRKELSEPSWFAMTSNVGRLSPGGIDLVHAYSKGYPNYSGQETTEKILHTLNDGGPHTCQWIKENCFDCGKDCGVRSPIVQLQRGDRTEVRDDTSLQEQINQLSKSPPYDVVQGILKEISQKEQFEKFLLISALADKTKISKKQLQAEVERFSEEKLELNDNTIIVHPAYDIQESFINLGFKITTVKVDRPVSQNVYIRSDGGEYQLYTGAVFELNGRKGVYDLRDRELLPLSNKWSLDQVKDFVEHPTAPIDVYSKVKDALAMFIDFADPAVYGLITTWIIGTYFHRLFHTYPFLSIFGYKETGKSKTQEVLEQLCMGAYKTRSVSVASLADTIDGTRGTFILDQAEILSEKNYADLLGILADSYTVGGGRRRIVVISSSGTRRVVEFETYGPKCFASTKDIDADLKDRTIEIVMVKAKKEYPDPDKNLPLWGHLRDQLYRLLLTKWKEAREIYPQMGQDKDIVQRVGQLWKPLDTILMLENVDEDERASIKEYFLRSMDKTQAKVSDLQEQLFRAIWSLLDGKKEAELTATDIRDKLALPEDEKFTKAKQVQWVGSVIRKFDLYNKKLPRDKDRRPYQFTRYKVADIARRFGIFLEEGNSGEFLHEDDEVI